MRSGSSQRILRTPQYSVLIAAFQNATQERNHAEAPSPEVMDRVTQRWSVLAAGTVRGIVQGGIGEQYLDVRVGVGAQAAYQPP